MTIIEDLADFTSELVLGKVPSVVIDKTKDLIMHHLHCGFAGLDETDSQIALKLVTDYIKSDGKATILGHRGRSSAFGASFANAVLMHSIQQEDTYRGLHPGPHTIPVAFSLAEEESISGRDVITSIIAGYEVNIKTGEACMKNTSPRGWRGTTIYGVMGAAATGSRVLGLDSEKTLGALANSMNSASGLMQCWLEGTSEWLFTSGLSAQNGVVSSLLAKEGADGARHSFEGDRGYFGAYCGEVPENAEAKLDEIGKVYAIPDVILKSYTVITTILPVVHNIVQLKKQSKIDVDDISSVKIVAGNRVTRGPLSSSILDFGPFTNKTQAYKSLPCATAIALIYGDVSSETVKHYREPDVSRLSKSISVETAENYEGFFNSVSIKDRGGQTFEIEGDEFPSLTSSEAETNLRNSASRYLTDSQVDGLIEGIKRIETLDMEEISEFLSLS